MEENPNLILTVEAKESGPLRPQTALKLSHNADRYVSPPGIFQDIFPNGFLDCEGRETTPSRDEHGDGDTRDRAHRVHLTFDKPPKATGTIIMEGVGQIRSEEHTSELQSP